ncbi:hypothetical protein PHISCL_00352 [Aspergillus sclerotialis]|uniref:Uncharacterized protein n=1 Tax=Aspergillus sclerotialis TaxID=2070753 RepID=A0A3A2ZW36_9EURO|nr:hypothetical protein PHISCL_00352 [Aspergillus sclerotialis]
MSANQSGSVYMASLGSARKPLSIVLLRTRSGSPQISAVYLKRKFVTSPRTQESLQFLDDDIGEVKKPVKGNAKRRVKQVQVQSIALMQGGHGTVVRNNQQHSKVPLPPILTMDKESLNRKIKNLESVISSTYSRIDQLISEYAVAKYSYISTQISACAREIQSLEKTRVRIGQTIIQNLSAELRTRRTEIHNLQIKVVLLMGDIVLPQISFIERLEKELVEPLLSGIQRAQANLKEIFGFNDKFDALHALSSDIMENLLRMREDVSILSKSMPFLETCFESHKRQLRLITTAFSGASHHYRYAYRRRIMYHYQGSWPFPLLINEVEACDLRRQLQRRDRALGQKIHKSRHNRPKIAHTQGTGAAVITSQPAEERVHLSRLYKYSHSIQLEAVYFPGPRFQDHPIVELDRRQFDVMAPFILVDEGGPAISTISDYLSRVSVPTLASRLGEQRATKYQKFFFDFNYEYRDLRATYRKWFVSTWELNWLRLMAEHKLSRLGEPNICKEKGLFSVSNPLSQDRNLFREWAKKVGVQRELNLALKKITRSRSALLGRGRRLTHISRLSRPTRQATTLRRRRVSLRRAVAVSKPGSALSTASRRLVRSPVTRFLRVKKALKQKERNFSRVPRTGFKSTKHQPKHIKTASRRATSPTGETARLIRKMESLRLGFETSRGEWASTEGGSQPQSSH